MLITEIDEIKKVERVLYDMLTECTGSHILDSGSAYGRNWERNQKKSIADFKSEPDVTHEIYADEVCYTISVWHYLVNQLDVDEICKKFNDLNVPASDWDSERFYGVSKAADDYIESLNPDEIGCSFNTYNHESFLSQVLQGCHLMINDEHYLILQIHQGCDVRGGYTDARLFKLYDGGWLAPEDVYGDIDGEECSNTYNGYSLTDESGNNVPVNEDSKVNLWVYFGG